MNPQSNSLLRAITGPIILITVGVLFVFDRFTAFHIGRTWPVLLIVVGLMGLLRGGGRRRGYDPPPPPPPPGYGGPGDRT
jgi:cell wall-active antibiotic response 4TMS protein YvqF